MRRLLVLALAGCVWLTSPAPGAAQAPPQEDSVSGSGVAGTAAVDGFSFEIDAHSGPSGENALGFVHISSVLIGAPFEGDVTCLAVSGNVATLRFFVVEIGVHVLLRAVDLPTGDRIAVVNGGNEPSNCADPGFTGVPVTAGDVVVVDAQPPPKAYGQCRQAGWVKYGFASHADCIDYVHEQARQKCIFERVAHGITAFRAKYGLGPNHDHAMRHCVRLYTGF